MMDVVVLIAVAFVLGLLILAFPYIQKLFVKKAENTEGK